jgi:hypothetical protein
VSLEKQADALRLDIRGLEGAGRGSPVIMTRASVEEREAAKLSSYEVARNLSAKRKKLTGVINEIIDRKKTLLPDPKVSDFPSEVAPGEQFKSSGPVYRNRSRQRADEKSREVDSGVYTSEQMSPSAYEYIRSGPERGETEVMVEGESKPRRYAVSRKREALKKALGLGGLSPTQPLRSMLAEGPMTRPYLAAQALGAAGDMALDAVTSLPRGIAGGYVRDVLSGERAPEGAMLSSRGTHLFGDDRYIHDIPGFSRPDYLPEKVLRGGIMSAPRGEVNEEKLALSLAERKRDIIGAKSEILRLRKELPNLKNPAKAYATIAVLEDDIEQLEAEQTQLLRVKNVTIPRQIAEAEAAKKADELQDKFATQF